MRKASFSCILFSLVLFCLSSDLRASDIRYSLESVEADLLSKKEVRELKWIYGKNFKEVIRSFVEENLSDSDGLESAGEGEAEVVIKLRLKSLRSTVYNFNELYSRKNKILLDIMVQYIFINARDSSVIKEGELKAGSLKESEERLRKGDFEDVYIKAFGKLSAYLSDMLLRDYRS